MESIFEGHPGAQQRSSLAFREIIIEFLDADPRHTVEISWVPSHVKIRGNERADAIAKRAASTPVDKPADEMVRSQ